MNHEQLWAAVSIPLRRQFLGTLGANGAQASMLAEREWRALPLWVKKRAKRRDQKPNNTYPKNLLEMEAE